MIDKLTSTYANTINLLYKQELDKTAILGSVYLSPKVENYISFILESTLEDFFGIIENRKLIAVIHLKKINGFLHINNIVVDSSKQGKGYGLKLMMHSFKLAKELNLKVSLDVDSNNIRAVNWYSHLGFKKTKETTVNCLKLKGNPKNDKITFLDKYNLVNFGFSEADISTADLINMRLFFIEPNIYKVKGNIKINKELIKHLENTLSGILLINSNNIEKDCLSLPYFNKTTYRMEKNDF